MVEGFKDNKGDFHPIGESRSGVSEFSFNEGKSTNILGTPIRKYSSATPSSERKALDVKVRSYVRGLNERVTAAHASGEARKKENELRRKKMEEQANKNLELASKFMMNAELLREGKTPSHEIKVENENKRTHEKLPRNLTSEQQKKIDAQKEQQLKQEIKVIEKIATTSRQKEPEQPIMPSGPPSINYSQESAPEPEEQQYIKSKKNFDELALESFPVSP